MGLVTSGQCLLIERMKVMENKLKIIREMASSDKFLDLSISCQALLLQLWIRADDLGRVFNLNTLLRMLNAKESDLNWLIEKRCVKKIQTGIQIPNLATFILGESL